MIDWDSQPLGRVSDVELARRLGVTSSRVGQVRRARGVLSSTRRERLPEDLVLSAVRPRSLMTTRAILQAVRDDWGDVSERALYRRLASLVRRGELIRERPQPDCCTWGYRRA